MGSNPVGITFQGAFFEAPSSFIYSLRYTNIIILDKYNNKLRLYNNTINLKFIYTYLINIAPTGSYSKIL